MERFGPYYSRQAIEFKGRRPVMLVHGGNMFGKTSILNAIRWALYGKALDRFGEPMPLTKLINQDASEAGNWTMSVGLKFEEDGDRFELVRAVQAKDPTIKPRGDSDFEEKLFMQRGGRHLNADEIQTELNRMMPEQISRFFLFDGELLNDYEVLLSSPDKQAQEIKDSIEHILGVPAITNVIEDLKISLKDASKRQNVLAKRDQDAKVYANLAADLEAAIDRLTADVGELTGQLEEGRKHQKELDDELTKTAGVEAEAETLRDINVRLANLADEQATKEKERAARLTGAWRDLVQPKVRARLAALRAESEKHLAALRELEGVSREIATLDALLTGGVCPTCGQSKTTVNEAEVQRRRADLAERAKQLRFDEAGFARAAESIRKLEQVRSGNVVLLIGELEDRLQRLQVDRVGLEMRRDEINERLKGHDQGTISRNRRDFVDITKEIGAIELSIASRARELAAKELEAKNARAQISRYGGPELERLNREVRVYDELISLFRATLDRMRDDLKVAVERDATEIFLRLTTDKTLRGLRINDRYGLSIIDQTGTEVPVRSAGAEQVVALSLIGALNRNAVRRGPVVMDTPFGRLDPKHRANILTFIPEMADQVALLVHGGEIDRDRDLAVIQDKVDSEIQIVKESSRRSRLDSVGGVRA